MNGGGRCGIGGWHPLVIFYLLTKRDCINPDAPVVIRVEGPRLDGYDDDLYWHVQSCGGADAGMDDDEACHDGMELGIMPIGRDFHSNGCRRKKGWLRSVPASSTA